MRTGDPELWHGVGYTLGLDSVPPLGLAHHLCHISPGLFLSPILMSFFIHQYFHITISTGMDLRTAMIGQIYRFVVAHSILPQFLPPLRSLFVCPRKSLALDVDARATQVSGLSPQMSTLESFVRANLPSPSPPLRHSPGTRQTNELNERGRQASERPMHEPADDLVSVVHLLACLPAEIPHSSGHMGAFGP